MRSPDAKARVTPPEDPFPLVEQVIGGVRVRAYDCAPWTLREVLENCRDHGDKDYLVFEDERYSFAETFDVVAALAQVFRDQYDIQKGDRVAIAMRNYPEFIFFFWATLAIGAVAVPLNAWWSTEELTHGLTDSGAVLLVADDERLTRMRTPIDASTVLRGVISARSTQALPGVVAFEELRLTLPTGLELPEVEVGPEDLATILYTSGTTGSSMGVPSTHRNHCTNIITTRALGSAGFSRTGAAPSKVQGGVAAHMPLFHISALGMVYLSAVSGTKVVLMRKWDTEVALELIETEQLTSFSGVPMQVQSLFNSPTFAGRDLTSLKTLGFAGSAITPDMVASVQGAFGGQVVARTGYGMTEATSAVTFITGQEYWDHPDSVGHPIPADDIRIVGSDGSDVPMGEPGEVWVRGPNVVTGYWNNPQASAEKFTDGWHHSGDVGVLDESGRISIVDRIKDVVIRAGENVYCGQVEGVIAEHPAVHTVIVLGLPHPKFGEEVVAMVHLSSGHQATGDELGAFAGARLAHFKVPSKWIFFDGEVPRTPTGKVLKRALKNRITPGGEYVPLDNQEPSTS